MGTYSDALALAAATGTTPSTDAVRNYRSKYGVALNLEQQLTPVLGMFARAGWTQGGVADTDFTDINQSLQIGLSLQGTRWGRPDDTVGLAAVANQISDDVKAYLAARGLGGIIGDGQLPRLVPNRSSRPITTSRLSASPRSPAIYQFVNNPAYNRQRGPVSVFALRLHAEF